MINKDEVKELVKRLNNQYRNIRVWNYGEYWKCDICNFESIDFGLVRNHHMEHELLLILNNQKSSASDKEK
jgi:hypothetical protein